MTFTSFDPAPEVRRGAVTFRALSGTYTPDGALATVAAKNGTRGASNTFLIANTTQREENGRDFGAKVGISAGDAISALQDLVLPVEGCLRHAPPAIEWPEPVPLSSVGTLPPFPVDVLPEWAQAYVRALATFTQTPPDLGAMLLLGVLAHAGQRVAEVDVQPGYTEPLCLYILVPMASGERKSAVYKAITAPIFGYMRGLLETSIPEIMKLESQQRLLEQRRTKAEREGDIAAACAAIEELAKLVVPARPQLLVQDSTPEHMVKTLAEQGGNLGAFDAEGGLLDTLTGRYSDDTVLDHLLKAHAGDPILGGRISRGSVDIAAPCLTICIAPQPEVLRGLAAKPGAKGRGLIARFLCALPSSSKGRRTATAQPIPDEVAEEYARRLKAMLTAGEPVEPGKSLARTPMPLTDQALARWEALFNWMEPQLAPGAALSGTDGWADKLCGQTARIAGGLHLADGREVRTQSLRPVSEDAMNRAIRVAKEYLLPHGQAALHYMGSDPALEDARVVLNWIERNKHESFNVRDVYRDLARRFGKPDDVAPALHLLAGHGFIREADTPYKGTGRKPTQRYDVNPRKPPATPDFVGSVNGFDTQTRKRGAV